MRIDLPAFRRSAAALAVATALTSGAVLAPSPAVATTRLHCSASASPSHPKQYSYLYINVKANARGAAVRTTAHYKTTTTSHGGHTGSTGRKSVRYYISRATVGYTVKVSVLVATAHQRATCSTSFTPR